MLKKRLEEIDDKTIVDDDPRIRKRQPSMRFCSAKEPSFEGPPLRRRAGRFKFKDKLTTSLKRSQCNSLSTRIAPASQNQTGDSGTETSMHKSQYEP